MLTLSLVSKYFKTSLKSLLLKPKRYYFGTTVLILFSTHSLAEVSIQTLDSWNIESYSPDSLMVRKVAEDTDSYLAIEVSRPFCICENLVIVRHGHHDFEDKQEIEGSLSFNFLRSKKVTFKVQHADKDWFIMGIKHFPSIRGADHLTVHVGDYFKDSYVLTGLDHVMKQSTKMCESLYPYEHVEPKEIKL